MIMSHVNPDTLKIGLACLIGMICFPGIAIAQSEGGGDTITVEMVDKGGAQWRFMPDKITVIRGDIVRFIQKDVVPHNVEFKDVPDKSNLGDLMMGPWLMAKGEMYEIVIDERFADGVHEYVCTPHAPMGMKGIIKVEKTGSVQPSR